MKKRKRFKLLHGVTMVESDGRRHPAPVVMAYRVNKGGHNLGDPLMVCEKPSDDLPDKVYLDCLRDIEESMIQHVEWMHGADADKGYILYGFNEKTTEPPHERS